MSYRLLFNVVAVIFSALAVRVFVAGDTEIAMLVAVCAACSVANASRPDSKKHIKWAHFRDLIEPPKN